MILNVVKNDSGAEIRLDGMIVADDMKDIYEWFGYQVIAPKDVYSVLDNLNGDPVTIKINSCGGSYFAGAEIYAELKAYKGDVKIIVTGLAASAASVIAMAGKCIMYPTAQLMIHNASSDECGDYRAMEHRAEVLRQVNKSIVAAYITKSPDLGEDAIKEMMNDETWLTAQDALDYGLIDEIADAPQNFNGAQNNIKAVFAQMPRLRSEAIAAFAVEHPEKGAFLVPKEDEEPKDGLQYADYMAKIYEIKEKINE